MKDLIEILEEESAKLRILRPRLFRYETMIGFITGLYHGRGYPLEKDPHNPKGSIGAFAQKNHYRILVHKLKALLRSLESKGHLQKGIGRIYCNSRFPEKSFALASGFGVRGKNSLVIVPTLGTFLVLGGVLFTSPSTPSEWMKIEAGDLPDIGGIRRRKFLPEEEEFPLCGSCKACQEACPTGALEQPGLVDTNRCLQAYASRPCSVPEGISAKWGTLFYGCDVCQIVCPHNTLCVSVSGTPEKWGFLGGGIELGKVLEIPDTELRKGLFRHSVLDIAWITPHTLKRNALLALSNQPVSFDWINPRWHLLEKYGNSPDPILRSAAEYTMKRIRNKITYI